MIAGAIPSSCLHLAWPDLEPLLAGAIARAGESNVAARIRSGAAQLWAVTDDDRPLAAVVTQVTLRPRKRCLLWLVGGRRLGDWADALLAIIEAWARAMGCLALWGAGRPGWARIAARHGFCRIADFEGLAAWERRI